MIHLADRTYRAGQDRELVDWLLFQDGKCIEATFCFNVSEGWYECWVLTRCADGKRRVKTVVEPGGGRKMMATRVHGSFEVRHKVTGAVVMATPSGLARSERPL
jgi:hypothetical protein